MNSGHRLLKRILKLGFLLMMGASMIADAFSSQKLNVKLTPLVALVATPLVALVGADILEGGDGRMRWRLIAANDETAHVWRAAA